MATDQETMLASLSDAFYGTSAGGIPRAGVCSVCQKACTIRVEASCVVLPPEWRTVEAHTKRRYVNFLVCGRTCQDIFDDQMFKTLSDITSDPTIEQPEKEIT